jgi:uncharacterized protein (DUF362 family)
VSEATSYLETLVSQAHPAGGWGYTPDQEGQLEPTCLALVALSLEPDRFADAIDKGKHFLATCATGHGTFRLMRGRDEAVWPTALVLFVQATLAYPTEEIRKTVSALLGLQGRNVADAADADIHDIDLKLVGWPWADGNASWAEPTAWACLALRRAGHGGHARVKEGLNLLLDRTCDGGGINYGNRRILGRTTEPIPGPTALQLLALQGKHDPRVAESVGYLARQAPLGDDLEHLCWAKLALDQHRDQPGVAELLPALNERIRAAYHDRAGTPYVHSNPLRIALTALALSTTVKNVFHIGNAPAAVECAPRTSPKSAFSLGRRLKAAFGGVLVNALGQMKPLPPQTPVHIATAPGYSADLAGVLLRQYEHFRERVPLKGKRVVLKPNLVEYHRDKVINTNPNVVAAVIELCRREEASEVIVAEGPGHWRNVEYLVGASGLGDVLRHYKVPFVDLNHDEPVKLPNLGRLTGLEHLYLSRTVASAEVFISLPKLKTHHWAGATLAMKNLFGTLPGICYGWPKNELHWRGIDNSIVDIALTRTPDLAIVDGIIGMEGDGPLNGTAKPMGVLVMGCDMVALDATCCRLMQLDPLKIGYLVMGNRKKLGLLAEAQIEQLGETIAALAKPFETVPHFNQLCMGRSA